MVQLKRNSFQGFLEKTRRLRIYRVSDIPKGGEGANEFHKHRSEILTAENGTFRLELENIRGRVKTVKLHEGSTYGTIPPFVLHTYIALTDHASLHVVANTLYDHYRLATHDTYSAQEFRKLQAKDPSSRRHGSR
jgi:quercetin dioxygenase-like cupin family protein